MNYKLQYKKLIKNRQENKLTYIKGKTPGIERHHIQPKCLGGSDEAVNIITLTAREHYIAHLLLHKMYPRSIDLLFVVKNFLGGSKRNKTRRNFRYNSRVYESVKKDVHYFLTNSKWIHNPQTNERRRIWNDEDLPPGYELGMGKASKIFLNAMNERAKKRYPVEYNGKIYSIKEISELFGIEKALVLRKLKAGWSIEQIRDYKPVKHIYTDNDKADIFKLFEDWKQTQSLSATISKNKHLLIFDGRHNKIGGSKLLKLFLQFVPEYTKCFYKKFVRKTDKILIYNEKSMSVKDWSKELNIPISTLINRLNNGWSIEDTLTIPINGKPCNFAYTDEQKEIKKQEAEQIFKVFEESGRGQKALAIINQKFNINIGYDGLVRKFKRYGVWKEQNAITYLYNGNRYTIDELSEISGVNRATLYERLVRHNLLDRYTMNELLVPKLIVKSKVSKKEKQRLGYEKYKPLFDLYLEKGGETEGYMAVCEKFGYDADYGNLRRQFNKYVPEYKEYLQKRIDSQFRVEYNGQMLTPLEISKLTGVRKSVLCSRLEDGWDIYEAISTPVGFGSDHEYRRNELSSQFEYWRENGFSGFNDRFNTAYKNEECITQLFRKYFKDEYNEIIRNRKIVLTVDGKSYTIKELAEKTGNTVATCRERLNRGCSVEEIMKSGRLVDADSPEHIAKMRNILIPYFESYSRRGFAEVIKDFPDCEYKSGSALRGAFNRYIPDLYKPSDNGAELRIKMGEAITINGVTKSIGEWAREYGLPVSKIRSRLDCGITGKDLLKKEYLNANQVEYNGKTYNGYAELARAFGIDRSTLLNRLKRGMRLDEALNKPVRLHA